MPKQLSLAENLRAEAESSLTPQPQLNKTAQLSSPKVISRLISTVVPEAEEFFGRKFKRLRLKVPSLLKLRKYRSLCLLTHFPFGL